MNARPMADARLAAGLRAHLPARAQAGLRERILAQVEETPQRRRLPTLLARIGDADPMGRRRTLLLVALLALALSISIGALVGAWLRSQDRTDDLSLTPPANVDAFVLGSYERLVQLPPFKMRIEYEATIDIFFFDGQEALRNEHPGGSPTVSIWTMDESRYLYNDLGLETWVVFPGGLGAHPLSRIAEHMGLNPNCVSGWRHVELAYVLERATHQVACLTDQPGMGPLEHHLWLDIATGLPMRSSTRALAQDEFGSLVPMEPVINEVTELEIGPQALELFVAEGPVMPVEQYNCLAYSDCASPTPAVSPTSAASPTPLVTPEPATDQSGAPDDLDALVAAVRERYAGLASVEIVIAENRSYGGLSAFRTRSLFDEFGNYRLEIGEPTSPTIYLWTGGRMYESESLNEAGVLQWHDRGPAEPDTPRLGLPVDCGVGWKHLGVDVIIGRRADHIACAFEEFWIDREWQLVTRVHDRDPLNAVDPRAGVTQVSSIAFGPQPPELFEPPPPEAIMSPSP